MDCSITANIARKTMKENSNFRHRHHSDVERLRRVILENGYEVNLTSAASIWGNYSEDLAAGWMGLPEDDSELWSIIKNKVKQRAQEKNL